MHFVLRCFLLHVPQELDSVGRVMVNVTDPQYYTPGGKIWSVAFIGTAGDLPLLEANGEGLLPEPSSSTRLNGNKYNDYPNEDLIAYWPTDSAEISVWEAQRGESVAEGEANGGGLASGTVDLVFDADRDVDSSETMSVDVGASASEVQAALRTLGGLLDGVEVSEDDGMQRARNGGGEK